MVLGLSITGVLAIIVIVLALIVVLLGMTGRVKRLDNQLKASEEDTITPYLRTTVHYRKSDFTDESKINALNKISKQFFRDIFHFSSEKTFDEIASLTEDADIKSFCSSMGIIRYSKVIRKSDIDFLYRSFENLLIKRRPASAIVLNDNSSKRTMTIDDLNSRKMRKDIVDIKSELEKMKAQEPSLAPQNSSTQAQTSLVTNPSRPAPFISHNNQGSLVKFSVDDKLSQMEAEIDSESVHDPNSKIDNSYDDRAQTQISDNIPQVPTIPNKVVSKVVASPPVQKIIRKDDVRDSHSITPYQAKTNSYNKKLSFSKVRLGSDDDSLSSEITSLNQRIQKLLDKETNRQLGEVGRGTY
ncbi:MAG: hypothetical protein AABW73_04875 [Nanoarchaeota archaeon]